MIVVLITVISLSILAIILTILPFLAAWHHINYEFNATILTATIGAMAGITTAIINKSVKSIEIKPMDADDGK